MSIAIGAAEQHFGQETGLARLGHNPQPFGEKQPFALAVLFLTQRTNLLDQRVGKSGDFAAHGALPSVFAEAVGDQPRQFLQRHVGFVALDMDGDFAALRRTQHHQPHNR